MAKDEKKDVRTEPCGQKCGSCNRKSCGGDDARRPADNDDINSLADMSNSSYGGCCECVSPGGFGPLWGPF